MHCSVHLDKWSPALQLRTVLLSLQLLLQEPNYDDPLNGAAANQWRANRNVFNRRATDWTRKYATPVTSTTPSPSASESSTATQNAEAHTTTNSPTSGASSANTTAAPPSSANPSTAVSTPPEPEIVPDPNFFNYF